MRTRAQNPSVIGLTARRGGETGPAGAGEVEVWARGGKHGRGFVGLTGRCGGEAGAGGVAERLHAPRVADVRCELPSDLDFRSVRYSMASPRPRSGLARADPRSRRFFRSPRRAGSTCRPKRRVCVGPPVRRRLLSPRSLLAVPWRSYTEGSRAAGPGGEECGSEEQLGPGEIGQFFLHGCANRFPWAAHGPLIYGGERPHGCGSELG